MILLPFTFSLPLDPWHAFLDFINTVFNTSFSVMVVMVRYFTMPIRSLIPGVADDLFLFNTEKIFNAIAKSLGSEKTFDIVDFTVIELMFGTLLLVTVMGFTVSFIVKIIKASFGLA